MKALHLLAGIDLIGLLALAAMPAESATPGKAEYLKTLLVCVLAYVVLIAIQVGCPLDFQSKDTKRYETPITPAAYAFSVWGIIFMLQAASVVITLVPGCEAWSRPIFVRAGYLLAATWIAEASWTTINYLQQEYKPGPGMAIVCKWSAAVALVSGHVLCSMALRDAVLGLQDVLKAGPHSQLDRRLLELQQHAYGAPKLQPSMEEEAASILGHNEEAVGILGTIGACVLYIFPIALNAGWMGLASCLGIMQVCAAHGISYTGMVAPGMGLLIVAACTLAAQPWCAVPPLPFSIKSHLPHIVAHLSYKAVLIWGLVGVRQADRPKQVHTLALWLMLSLPIIGTAGLSLKLWLADRMGWGVGPNSPIGYHAAPSVEAAK